MRRADGALKFDIVNRTRRQDRRSSSIRQLIVPKSPGQS